MITRRGELGIAGAIVVLSQTISAYIGTQGLSRDISEFKEEYQRSLLDQEHFFARKTDISPIADKLDHMSNQIGKLKEEVSSLKTFLKTQYGYENAQASCSAVEHSNGS